MIFHMDLQGSHRLKFFNAIVQCLLDFNELNPSVPVATFFQGIMNMNFLNFPGIYHTSVTDFLTAQIFFFTVLFSYETYQSSSFGFWC